MSAHVIHRGLQQLETSHRELVGRIAERLAEATQQNAAGNAEAVAAALRDLGEAFATSTAQIDAMHVTAIALVQQQVPLSAFAVAGQEGSDTAAGAPDPAATAASSDPAQSGGPATEGDTLTGSSTIGAATGEAQTDTSVGSQRRARTSPTT